MPSPIVSLGRWRARRAAERLRRDDERVAQSAPIYVAGTQRMGLLTGGSQPTTAALLREFNGWGAIAARAVANRLLCLDLEVVEVRREQSGTVVEEVLDEHPLVDVLAQPNPVFSTRQILALLGYWLAHNGEAYLLKVGNGLRLPAELWPLPPQAMELVSDPGRGIGGYVYHSPAGETRYELEDVVRVWMPDPANPFGGLGALGPQAIVHDASKFLDQTVRKHFESDANPKTAIIAQPTASVPTGEALTRFLRDWRQRYARRTGTMAGLPAFIPPGFDVKEFAAFGGVEETAPLIASGFRDRILMAYGVPRSVLGDVVDANRAAAETNQFVFDTHTVVPLTVLIADALTNGVARDFDPMLRIRFAEFVADDKDHTLKAEGQDLLTKVRTVNQVREDRGLDPVAWGEEPIGSFGDVPYRPEEAAEGLGQDDPNAFGEPAEDDEPEAEGDDDEEPRSRSGGVRSWWTPAAAWVRFLQTEHRYRPEFERAMRAVFAAQRDAVLEELPTLRTRGQRDALEDLFDPTRWSQLFRRLVEPVRRRAYREIAQDVLAKTGSKEPFRFNADVERSLLRQGAALMARVNDTTRKAVRRAIVEGVDAGEGQDAIAARIRETFRTRRDHARTIARTEVLRASSGAHLEGFRQSGAVVGKVWNTSQDDAVRDSHEETDGQEVGNDEAFVLGDGEQAEAPGIGAGGADLSPGNAINCRCFVTPVFASEV